MADAKQASGAEGVGAQLSSEQQGWLDASLACVERDHLRDLVAAMVSIPSPTGDERPLAQFLSARLAQNGLNGRYQPIDDRQGNALGRYSGKGGGADLLLYAPIDTHLTGTAEEDVPWSGPEVRRDRQPFPILEDGLVIGLCAENPKGFASCVVAAAEAIAKAGVPLKGDLLVGLGAGGMPTNARPGSSRLNTGQGNGCSFMLEQGFRGDFAVIAKGGWAVAWEEVGLSWFRIRVHGYLGYTGQRRRLQHKNPIVLAARVIEGLEEWFPEYTRLNTSGLVEPEGSIGAIEGGWTYKPTFIPAACDIYLDLRLSPRTDPMDARSQLLAALERIKAANPDLDLTCEMVMAVPGATTAPDNWIVQSGIRAWEAVAGRKHVPRTGTSGATDANILRGRGIPTARIGIPPPSRTLPYANTFSMGVIEIDGMVELTKCLIRIAIDTCTRTRAEVGLGTR
jgi:acetylornithine deacetylase/succinyl-diaminopimelate desuccinylase-like protein